VIIAVVWLMKAAFYPNTEPAVLETPNLLGLTRQQAIDQIESRGLVVGDIEQEQNDNQPAGRIIRQSPEAGARVQEGVAVDLWINVGREEVTVPDVTGTTINRAQSLLEAQDLTLGKVEEFFHATEPAGIVYEQEPAPGTRVEEGTGIALALSKGPEEEEAPINDVEDDEADQEPTEPDDNGTVEDDDEQEPPPPSDPYVDVREIEGTSGDRQTRRFEVSVAAKGQQPDQSIVVRWRDESGATLKQDLGPMQPGQTETVEIREQRGAVTIEVEHQGQVVFTETMQAPETEEPPQ